MVEYVLYSRMNQATVEVEDDQPCYVMPVVQDDGVPG